MKIKTFLLTCFLAIYAPFCLAQDSGGQVILDLDEQDRPSKLVTFKDMLETSVEVGKYFENNYPDNKIDEDLKPDIERFFPASTPQQLYNRESFIRKSIKIYRWGKQAIAKVKEKFLTPEPPILTYLDSEYENPQDYTYQDAGEDNVLITTDIKKVISYSPDINEKKNYEAYLKRHEDIEKMHKKYPEITDLKRLFDKLEFKKLPYYGQPGVPDPKTNGEGISPWITQNGLSTRLAVEYSRLADYRQIKGVIHFFIDKKHMMLAIPYKDFKAPTFSAAQSENLKNCSFFIPAPYRFLFADGDLSGFVNSFGIPFTCEIINNKKPAKLNVSIAASLCDAHKQCSNEQTQLSLPIFEGYGFETMMQNFINQSFIHLPDTQEKDIIIKDLSIEDNKDSPTGKTLRLIFDSSRALTSPSIFIDTEQNTEFSRPRIAIDNQRISARLDILSPDHNLVGKTATITIRLDNTHSYRLTKEILPSSIFDFNSRKLTLGMLTLAVLGGFLLNFMPCVFPVLSLKFLSFTQFGAKNKHRQTKDIYLSIGGIFIGFLGLAILLVSLKLSGQALGWGIQFQNPIFLITMIFLLLLFIAQMNGIISLNIFPPIGLKQQSSICSSLFSGFLIVIMATPCTGPYLGTVIGFALSGTPIDILAIFTAIALGLSLPYILLLIIPALSYFIPTPGPWMQKLHTLMKILLLLTILWLMSILRAQSSWSTLIWLSVIMLIFYCALLFFSYCLAETQKQTYRNQPKLRPIIKTIAGTILCLIFAIALIIGQSGIDKRRTQTISATSQKIDFAQIGQYVSQGYNVIVKVGADWCLTCAYNDLLVFDNFSALSLFNSFNVKIVAVDWTEYNPEILKFMSDYGRRGLPFYILYNRNIPEGMVLPEILSVLKLGQILQKSNTAQY